MLVLYILEIPGTQKTTKQAVNFGNIGSLGFGGLGFRGIFITPRKFQAEPN